MKCLRSFCSSWQSNTHDVTDAVHVNYNVTNCTPWYEPFYVARADAPGYDERFIGYGFTRNTQVHYFYVSCWPCPTITQQPSYGITYIPSFVKFDQMVLTYKRSDFFSQLLIFKRDTRTKCFGI
jgi:hypothetical protein